MMNDLINKQTVLDIVDDLRDRMTVEGYCAMIERVKALPSAHLVDKDIDVPSNDCISRQMLLEYIHGEPVGKLLCDKYNLDGLIEQFPSAQPETAKRIVGKSRDGMTLWYQCDICNEPVDAQDNFCRGCGRRLIDE